MAKWKIVFSAVIVVAILVLVFAGSASKTVTNVIGSDLGFINPQKLLSGISTGLSSLLSPIPAGDYFSFILTSQKDVLNGRSFEIENGTAIISGNFVTDVFIGDTVYDVSLTKGEIYIQNLEGAVEFGSYGTVTVSGQVTGISINGGTVVRPADKSLSVKFEIIPSEYFFAPIVQNNIKFAGVNGQIERTDGKAAIQIIDGEDVEISGFIGSFKLAGDLSISGAAKVVKSKTFSWTG